jgi:DNA-binding transcriptional MerR regulator
MKTGKVAKALGIDTKTVKIWSDMPEFAPFLTDDAKGLSGHTQRHFYPEDVLVLNTIRAERAKRTDWSTIAMILSRGQREEEMPPEFYTVDGDSAVVQFAQMTLLRSQLADSQVEAERLRRELGESRTEVKELYKQIGKLEAQLEMLMRDDE